MKLLCQKSVLSFIAATALSTVGIANAAIQAIDVPLTCDARLKSGTYAGFFSRIIDKDDWNVTNYEFTTDSGQVGCVRASLNSHERRKIIFQAFLKGMHVTIATDGISEITGIDYLQPAY